MTQREVYCREIEYFLDGMNEKELGRVYNYCRLIMIQTRAIDIKSPTRH